MAIFSRQPPNPIVDDVVRQATGLRADGIPIFQIRVPRSAQIFDAQLAEQLGRPLRKLGLALEAIGRTSGGGEILLDIRRKEHPAFRFDGQAGMEMVEKTLASDRTMSWEEAVAASTPAWHTPFEPADVRTRTWTWLATVAQAAVASRRWELGARLSLACMDWSGQRFSTVLGRPRDVDQYEILLCGLRCCAHLPKGQLLYSGGELATSVLLDAGMPNLLHTSVADLQRKIADLLTNSITAPLEGVPSSKIKEVFGLVRDIYQ